MLWPDLIIARPLEYYLRFMSVWPEDSNKFGYPYFAVLSIFNMTFQFFDAVLVVQNMELLINNLTNLLLIVAVFTKVTFFWMQRWCVKEILSEMIDDWRNIKNPEERIIMNNHVQYSHQFFLFSITVYHFTICMFFAVAVWSYFTESVENRQFPLQATFPFPSRISPVYELLCFIQLLLLFMVAVGYGLIDSFYVASILHAATEIDMVRFEIDRFISKKLQVENKISKSISVEILIEKHLKVLRFSDKIEEVFAKQLVAQFVASMIGICIEGFILLMLIEDSKNIYKIFKYILLVFASFWEIGTYCVVGDYLQSKSVSIAEYVYLQSWYELRSTADYKILMMIIQKAQKPILITAGKFIPMSLFSLTNLLKASASYLSVLRAMRN